MKIRAIVTGATGMVGEGILHECLAHPDVEQVLIINRRPSGVSHPKLKEIIHANFFDVTSLEDQLRDYNACFFALGVSSVGLKEDEYRKLTYDLTLHFAGILARLNKDMTFCYVSGSGTDSSEKGKSMWARVKGKTENDLLKLPFKGSYMFRPGYMHPTRGLKNTLKMVHAVSWLYPIARPLFPGFVCTLKEVGLAMIQCAKSGYTKPIIEVPDIVALAARP
ncbi:MAG: NAD-dependent epimerase/dehydratase family protein [Leptospirales bacterium]|nr:NAD-dependent epimerase/dehydratase family protein [Leptospirales bacterium]